MRDNALSVVPRSIPPEIACTLSCAIGTELHGIRDVARTQAGDTVLVTGAGGGLGIHGVQVAKLCGACVVALTTTPAKEKAIRAVGADQVVVVTRGERFDQKLRDVAPGGFDVICDNVGEPVFNSAFGRSVGGRYVFIGQLNDRSISFNPAWLLLRSTALLGSNSSTRRELDEVVKMVDHSMSAGHRQENAARRSGSRAPAGDDRRSHRPRRADTIEAASSEQRSSPALKIGGFDGFARQSVTRAAALHHSTAAENVDTVTEIQHVLDALFDQHDRQVLILA